MSKRRTIMSVNKVLLPITPGNDFAAGGGNIGWVETNVTNPLTTISNNVITTNGTADLQDHAIPSPVAHIKHFKQKLENGDADAVNEWRGMLAVIALQKLKGYNITIEDIPLYPDPVTGKPTDLGSVFFDELIANGNITGYHYLTLPNGNFQLDQAGNKIPNCKTLSVFCKDGIPFAMFMPSMLICPFKSYPIDLFSGLPWYNATNRFDGDPTRDPKGSWTPVMNAITSGPQLSVTAQKLYFWITNIANQHLYPQILAYQQYISPNGAPASNAANNPVSCNYGNVGACVYSELKDICPLPTGAPQHIFSDKVLFIIPSNTTVDNVDRGSFTPKKSVFFNTNHVYVVPPIHSDVVNCIRGGHATLTNPATLTNNAAAPANPVWTFTRPNNGNGNKYICSFSLYFPTGEVLDYTKEFSDTEIAWTNCLPYISMWPNVNFSDDSWHEHYIAIYAVDGGGAQIDNAYGSLTSSQNTKQLLGKRSSNNNTAPEISISLVPKANGATVDEYAVTSAFDPQRRNPEIKLLSSTSQPFALEFSYVDHGHSHTLGGWILDRGNTAITPNPGRRCCVAMDFGTTSTNVYWKDAAAPGIAHSISTAGKYLCDIYNPFDDGAAGNPSTRDFIQNYYLFSSSSNSLGKIFTYGQNFTTTKNNIQLGGTVSNASGRMVVVDDRFIRMGQVGSKSGIYNSLKMRGLVNDPDRDAATDNFICNVLTYAILEAKAYGASAIDLRISYPSQNFGAAAISSIQRIGNDLSVKSNMQITISGATEASAAGEYFANALSPAQRPLPSQGYAIIDIGGGTTDFSFWKSDPNGATNAARLRAEHSFGYAGNYLVERSIIQGIQGNNAFTQMWSCQPNSVEAYAIQQYNGITIRGPIGTPISQTIADDFYQKSSTIDFLLEKCAVNTGVLLQAQYSKFLSAVRMKYYSLFYLIANYIKVQVAKGNIAISPNNFRICLAGCGSKGMSFARIDPAINFDNNLCEIFKGVLNLYTTPFDIVDPQSNDKEEVVIGLTIPSTGANIIAQVNAITPGQPAWSQNNAAQNNAAQAIPQAPALNQNVVNALRNAYTELLDMLAYYELPHDAAGQPMHNGNSLVDLIDIDASPVANNYYLQTYAGVYQYVVNSNPDPDTFNETFALFMLENMIDMFI